MSTSASEKELLDSARRVLALAKKNGATDASATATRSRDVETVWRDGSLEKVSDATSRSIWLALYIDGKYGSMSTSDLRPQALEKFVEDAAGLVRALAKDPHRKLPDPSLYADRTTADLEVFDERIGSITPDDRIARAKEMEEGARSMKKVRGKTIFVTSTVSDSTNEIARASSNGFEGTYRTTSAWNEAEVAIKDEDRRPSDWEAAGARFVSDMPPAQSIGDGAAYRAVSRVQPKKMKSAAMTIVVEARAAGSLLRHLAGPLSGGALQQKESFYEGKLGTPVASKLLTITDDPLLKRGLASRPFDSEGITTKARPVIDAGVLKMFYLDVYYANKLGMAPTTGRGSNVVITPGKKSLQELLHDMKNGILVTSFLGGNSNSTTGVFSLGIQGLRIENGERIEAISEMNLSGKHTDFWKHLVAVGSDPYLHSSWRSPSLVFEGVSIAGK